MAKFSLILSTGNTSLSRVRNENIWDEYIKIEICLTITKINKSEEKTIYLLFDGFKKTYTTNELKRSHEIVDNLV